MPRATYLQFLTRDRLTQYPEDLVNNVAPGVLELPVDKPIIKKSASGVESVTLPAGTPGQVILVQFIVGTSLSLTPNKSTGFTSVGFLHAKDQVTLMYVDDIMGWIILGVVGPSTGIPLII